MKTFAAITIAAALLATPAFAATGCSTSLPSQYQPQSTLEATLKSEGLNVLQIKIENGCYEVYAKDSSGNRVNRAYNAETLDMLDNAEAGEG